MGHGTRTLDLSRLRVAERFAAGATRALPATRAGLLALVNEVGLTGPWVKSSARSPASWHGLQPPREMRLDDLRRDVRRVRDAFVGYERGWLGLITGDLKPDDLAGDAARQRFNKVMVPMTRALRSGSGARLSSEVRCRALRPRPRDR